MQPLVSAKSMREIDAQTVRHYKIPEVLLMEHAAMAIVGSLIGRYQKAFQSSRGLVLAGHGNNGADAIAAARILWMNGHRFLSIVVDKEQKGSPLFNLQLSIAAQAGIPISNGLPSDALSKTDWVLDGIFGSGLTRPVDGVYADWIQETNTYANRKFIVAIDVPSGVDSTTGQVLGSAIQAHRTVTLGFYKSGLVTGQALNHVGALSLASIQIPRELAADHTEALLLEPADVRAWLPKRPKDSHKGTFGKVSIVAGESSMLGASALSALGALRSGAGLVSVLTSEDRSLFASEVIVKPIEKDSFESDAVIVVGPGLGTSNEARGLLMKVLAAAGPLVIDGDALTLLSDPDAMKALKKRTTAAKAGGPVTVLTPHPKEASRLLGIAVENVQAHRYEAARKIAENFDCIAVLKGAGSIVSFVDPSNAARTAALVVPTGDAGLAKGGTGDVLAGVCAGFLAQGVTSFAAAAIACYLHGRASEVLTQRRGQGISTLASEVADSVEQAISELAKGR